MQTDSSTLDIQSQPCVHTAMLQLQKPELENLLCTQTRLNDYENHS